jgi:multidrug transporter EmrE-like cation transporter
VYEGNYVLKPGLLAMAAFNGVLFFVHLLVLLASYNYVGVGITQAMTMSGNVLPVLMAWLLWPADEVMTPVRWLGVALMPIALFFMRPNNGEPLKLNFKKELILLLPFCFTGIIGCLHKIATVRYGIEGRATYQAVLFTLAMISSWAYVLWQHGKVSRKDVGLGVLVGAVNYFALFAMILALSEIAASVFFPIGTSVGIALTLAASWILWNEKISKRQLLGILIACTVVALINSQQPKDQQPGRDAARVSHNTTSFR